MSVMFGQANRPDSMAFSGAQISEMDSEPQVVENTHSQVRDQGDDLYGSTPLSVFGVPCGFHFSGRSDSGLGGGLTKAQCNCIRPKLRSCTQNAVGISSP